VPSFNLSHISALLFVTSAMHIFIHSCTRPLHTVIVLIFLHIWAIYLSSFQAHHNKMLHRVSMIVASDVNTENAETQW